VASLAQVSVLVGVLTRLGGLGEAAPRRAMAW
jgi:hypothetical protein